MEPTRRAPPPAPAPSAAAFRELDAIEVTMGPPPTATAGAQGTLLGTVDGMDYGKGALWMAGPEGRTQINAAPQQLLGLLPGQVLSVPYRMVGDVHWWWPELLPPLPEGFSVQGELTGPIESMNRVAGSLTVSGQTVRAHPRQLLEVMPGQMVSVAFVSVEDARWVHQARVLPQAELSAPPPAPEQ